MEILRETSAGIEEFSGRGTCIEQDGRVERIAPEVLIRFPSLKITCEFIMKWILKSFLFS